MTDARSTQEALEQWAQGTPRAQATQIAVEQWSSAQAAPVIAAVTQVALQQWAVVPPVQVGGCSLYGVGIYGRAKYGGCNYVDCGASWLLNIAFNSANIDVPTAVFLQGALPLHFTLTGDVRTGSVYLGGSLALRLGLIGKLNLQESMAGSLNVDAVILQPADLNFYTGSFWAPDAPCSDPWALSDPCPPSPWTPSDPCPSPWEKD
jgi:hypothetical protein